MEGTGLRHRIAAGSGVALLALLSASAALAGPSLRVGAVEDAAKWADPAAKMDLAGAAGFDTVRMTAQWSAGLTAPSSGELANLQNAAAAAAARGIRPVVSIYNVGSGSTPAEEASRAQFVQYASALVRALPAVSTFIVGNEPNSNYYWLPQFDAAGGDAAAQAYEALLAAAYDALKAIRPGVTIVGGALDPRGNDNPAGAKLTHSPTSFIRDLGAAYRASGRSAPLMDVFDLHVYADNSSLPPSMEHPNTTTIAEADYGKLVALLGQAFDGTGQPGSSLPILYGEFGVESAIPAAKASLYNGSEPTTTRPVDEAQQARYYSEAFKLAMCQPNVIGILAFHVSDESALSGWQSGPYYADDSAKSSLTAIRDAANAARAGTLTSCPDTTPPTVTLSSPAAGTPVGPTGLTISGNASDDVGIGKIELLANGVLVATKFAAPYTFTWTPTTSGSYTLELRAYDAARNTGTASTTVTAHLGPPDTTITAAPPATTPATDASFSFTSSEALSTFRCSLDGAPFVGCGSPAGYSGLAPGTHAFQVEAVDAAADADPTPAAYTWTIEAPAPPPEPPPAPAPPPAPPPPAPPPAPASGGGASGGGGSGGSYPDLHVELSAEQATAPPVGSQVVWHIAVSDRPATQSAFDVFADVTLPAGFTVTNTASDRGSGCVAAAAGLTCSLDYVGPENVGHVIVWGTVGRAGPQTLAVDVRHFLQDGDPTDDAATLTLAGAAAAPAAAASAATALSPPRISGTARPGRVLRASAPVWSAPPSQVLYRWQRCAARGCTAIRGATRRVVKLTSADAGRSVRIVATATIEGTSVTSASKRIPVGRR